MNNRDFSQKFYLIVNALIQNTQGQILMFEKKSIYNIRIAV